jgi:hypothetical protein
VRSISDACSTIALALLAAPEPRPAVIVERVVSEVAEDDVSFLDVEPVARLEAEPLEEPWSSFDSFTALILAFEEDSIPEERPDELGFVGRLELRGPAFGTEYAADEGLDVGDDLACRCEGEVEAARQQPVGFA